MKRRRGFLELTLKSAVAKDTKMKYEEFNLSKNADGLLPVVVQDCETLKVLMVAYMNKEAYEKTCETGKATFCDELQKAQNTDTFTRTAPADLGIAETQLKLDKVAAAGRAVDYSGMTKTEIYAEIENRYKEAFDDFYTARSVCITKEQIMILNQFNAETEEKVGISNINSELVRNARGYKGTSVEKIESEIKNIFSCVPFGISFTRR